MIYLTVNIGFMTICFVDEISEEPCNVVTASVVSFYDCDNNEIFDLINAVNSLFDDFKQKKHKSQAMKKQLKYQ